MQLLDWKSAAAALNWPRDPHLLGERNVIRSEVSRW